MADIDFLAGLDVGHRCQPHCAFLQTLRVLSEGLKTTSRSYMPMDVFNGKIFFCLNFFSLFVSVLFFVSILVFGGR